MDVQDESVELLPRPVILTLAHIDRVALGVAAGLVTGFWIFVATAFLIFKGGEIVGPNLYLLSQYFVGYTVSFAGALLGAGYGFLCGFLAGYFFATLRNFLVHGYLVLIFRRSQRQAFNDLP